MLSENENHYMEKWTSVQQTIQSQRRTIMGLIGLAGILALVLLFAGQSTPLIVEQRESVFYALNARRANVPATREAVAELVKAFVQIRYEWEAFNPEAIVKRLEPLTTEGLRGKLMQEFGKKPHENKKGNSIEQSVARIRPDISEKAVLATFDRVLRVNGVPIVVPMEVNLLLVEGPKTTFNPVGLYINGVIEREGN